MTRAGSAQPLRIAIAGFGWWGRHIASRLTGHGSFKIITVVEPNVAIHSDIKAAGFDIAADLDAVLTRADVDAVVLTTPNPVHEEQVVACAKAGKHVFCEKPLGLTAASARRSVAAVREAGVQLGIGHERRFEPGMMALKTAIDDGALGTIMHAELAFSHDKLVGVPKDDWRASKAVSPAAGMTAMGIHLTDLLISFFGPVKTVQAMTASRSLGWETGDTVTAQLGFDAGMTATLSAVLHTPHFIRCHVFGTRQWIEVINESHPDTPGGKVTYRVAETGQDMMQDTLDWRDTVTANLEAFGAAIAGAAPYPFTTDQMIHNIEVLEAITRSAEDRRTVEVSEL